MKPVNQRSATKATSQSARFVGKHWALSEWTVIQRKILQTDNYNSHNLFNKKNDIGYCEDYVNSDTILPVTFELLFSALPSVL